MKIFTYDNRKRRQVTAGELENGVFVKRVTDKHYMRMFRAYAIQSDVMSKLEKCECKTIRLMKGKKTVDVIFDLWFNQSQIKNMGHGKQYFYSVNRL